MTSQLVPLPGLGQAQSSYQLLSATAELCSRATAPPRPLPDIFPPSPPWLMTPWGGADLGDAFTSLNFFDFINDTKGSK